MYHERGDFEKILNLNVKQATKKLSLSRPFGFQYDNNQKYKSLSVKDYLQRVEVKVLEWPA